MVVEPSVHVGNALDGKPPAAERAFQCGQAWVASGFQRGGLLADEDVLGDAVAEDAADAGEIRA